MIDVEPVDRRDARFVNAAAGLLQTFNDAGVLAPADVHVALRLARLAGEEDDTTLLAAALAVRGPRLDSVCVDLATIRGTATTELETPLDLDALPWPEPQEWLARVASSSLVAVGEEGGGDGPLRLVGTTLYLDRYWRDERMVAAALLARSGAPAVAVDGERLAEGLARLFGGDEPDLQRLAAGTAVLRRLAVVGGGPGTGKTTTIARIVLLVDEQADAAGGAPPLVGLAAPTGKAAARLEEALHAEASALALDEAARVRLVGLRASTVHRLLGARGRSNRFRHDRRNQLPHDVVVVDETSMVSLSLMARLLEAVRADARLILVGDPRQLASVEVGAVLGDVVGPAADGMVMRAPARRALAEVAGQEVPAGPAPPGVTIGDGIVVLRRGYRFSGAIADLAEAIRIGDADSAVAVLGAGHDDVRWVAADVADPAARAALAPVRAAAVAAGEAMVGAARAGDAAGALGALASFRLLCAHRRGPYGVATWNATVEGWLSKRLDRFAESVWYVGRPLLVTENDYPLRLYNGDTGVIVARPDGRTVAVFDRQGEPVEVAPTRLGGVDTVYALTIHKSQGSQADSVAVLLPDERSPILTRELVYTAVTRARKQLIVCGTEAAIRAGVERPVAHASGLRRRLWGT